MMPLMNMKISESTEFKIDLKTVIGIIMLTTTLVGMYYTLQEDIALAKTLPPVEVTRLESVSYTHLTLPTNREV